MKREGITITAFLCTGFLAACIPQNYSEEEAQHLKNRGIADAEEFLDSHFKGAVLLEDRFRTEYCTTDAEIGTFLSDWTVGVYKHPDEETIVINDVTGEVYTTEYGEDFDNFCYERLCTLTGLGEDQMTGAAYGMLILPARANDASFGTVSIYTRAGSPMAEGVTEADYEDILNGGSYDMHYEIVVSEDADLSVFENMDCSSLGCMFDVRVRQYPADVFLRFCQEGVFIRDAGDPLVEFRIDEKSWQNEADGSVSGDELSGSEEETDGNGAAEEAGNMGESDGAEGIDDTDENGTVGETDNAGGTDGAEEINETDGNGTAGETDNTGEPGGAEEINHTDGESVGNNKEVR